MPTPLTELDLGQVSHRWPQVLPGNKAYLFTSGVGYGDNSGAEIAIVTLADRRRNTLMGHAGMYPRYLLSGQLVYVVKGALFAAPFDLGRYEVRDAGARLQEIADDFNFESTEIDFSRT